MASDRLRAAAHITKQLVLVIAASYLGACVAIPLYMLSHGFGFHFLEIAGDLSMLFFAGLVVAPTASVLACVLVSRHADHIRASKLGILLGFVASYFGSVVELTIVDAAGGGFLLLWPAIVGCYSFLGYQAGLIVGRRWRQPKHAPKAGR